MLSFNLPSSLTLLLLTATASSWTFARPSASCAPVFNADASPDQLAIPSRATTDTDVDTSPNSNNFSWRNTKNIISFGDSYTQTGWDVTKGVNSTDPGATSANGPCWLQTLVSDFSPSPDLTTFNLAYGGATIDKDLAPSPADIISLEEQVGLFHQYLADSPKGARWTPEDTLFVVWIGINDILGTYLWTGLSHAAFYAKEHRRLLALLSSLKSTALPDNPLNFLLLTVPPLARAPLVLSQGEPNTNIAAHAVDAYNDALHTTVADGLRQGGSWVGVFDTVPVFNTLLDNAPALGFVEPTSFNELYTDGTETPTTQYPGYPPVSSYFWLNDRHPTWSVHTALAQAVGTFLGALNDAERQKRTFMLAQSGGTEQHARAGWAAAFFSSFFLLIMSSFMP